MARTNPHHDWPEPQSGAPKANGAEWESLRNELVALLDQVEDHVANVKPQPVFRPAPRPAPQPARHNEALKSVRQAVSRLADRGGEEHPVMRDSVVQAINQIRARQTGRAHVAPASVEVHHASVQPADDRHLEPQAPVAPAPAIDPEIAGLAKSLDALGERIGAFESQIGEKLDTLDNRADISGQIAQLSEVIEMLASAVGETGQIRRIEAQIGDLAEMLANDRQANADSTAERIEELTGTIEKLITHQMDTSSRHAQTAVDLNDRQTQSFERIESSVRSIYDRIDALEAAQAAEPAFVDKLSKDMAALSHAVTTHSEPTTLIEKIDALSQRIAGMQAPSRDEAETLAQSVVALRAVISESLEPRFAVLEDGIEALKVEQPSDSNGAIEAQLRQIAQRVEETSMQLKSLAEMREVTPDVAANFDALAERIIEQAHALAPRPGLEADAIDKADLAALEERLANLFARTGSDTTEAASNLAGVKSSINQVDSRIARLETMLNSRAEAAEPAIAAQAPAAEPTVKRRAKPEDVMPFDPTTGDARRVLSQSADIVFATEGPQPAETLADEPADLSPQPFAIDPETIERPVKPQSSFIAGRENPFELSDSASENHAEPVASRSSFIEAARRSARQPEPEAFESKSLIGRALARFQRSEAEMEPEAPLQPQAAEIASGPFGEQDVTLDDNRDPEAAQGFLARNRRALLLGTALVVAIALAVPLALDRLSPAAPNVEPAAQAVEPAPAAEAEPETSMAPEAASEPDPVSEPQALAPEAIAEEVIETGEAGSLTSGVRIIEQQPSLTAARVDAATMRGPSTLDPIQTAAISAADTAVGELSYAAAPMTSAALPAIDVPSAIEPAELRAAAEEGDMYAQFEVGAILTEGTVVEQDFEQAAAWYERSAAQGFAPAQYRLGSLYESGRGVEQDLEMSRLWYQRAAEAGNRMSMHNLASLYAGGELGEQDFQSAAHWFEQAAARGMTDSQFNLGMLYARGLGVEQDFEQSYVWFSLAARAGDEDAATARDDVARSLDAAAVQRLDDTVDGWMPAEFDLAANFAPIGTWNETFDPGPAIANTDVILRVQMLLAKLGFDIGTPDGIAGPRTREAIASFERQTGMTESGGVNPRLLAVLGSQPV